MKSVFLSLFTMGLLLNFPSLAKAEYIKAETCVNLREEPNINSPVITCLPSGQEIELVRHSQSGTIAWVEDSENRVWYLVRVLSQNINGWVVADFITDSFEKTQATGTTLEQLEDGYYSFSAENLEGIFRKTGNNIVIKGIAYQEDSICYQGNVSQNSVTNVAIASRALLSDWEFNRVESINFNDLVFQYQKITPVEDSHIKEIEECTSILNSN